MRIVGAPRCKIMKGTYSCDYCGEIRALWVKHLKAKQARKEHRQMVHRLSKMSLKKP